MRYFTDIANIEWDPTFIWVPTVEACAKRINEFHPDLPKTPETLAELINTRVLLNNNLVPINNELLLKVHSEIFSAHEWAGGFRMWDVMIGYHRPPSYELIPHMMEELAFKHENDLLEDVKQLTDWYYDFEAIHPFPDGNGRVGGVIVAVYAHTLHPEMGWLSPNQ